MRPVMPATLKARLPMGEQGVDEYVKELVRRLEMARGDQARPGPDGRGLAGPGSGQVAAVAPGG